MCCARIARTTGRPNSYGNGTPVYYAGGGSGQPSSASGSGGNGGSGIVIVRYRTN